jgi:hypothetical protein
MLRSKLELGFENLTSIVRSSRIEVGTDGEADRLWTTAAIVATAKMEDLVGEEAPVIFMDFKRWRSSKSWKWWI